MEFENMIKLIKAVSESSLTEFSYKKDNLKISMKTEKGNQIITAVSDGTEPVYSPVKEIRQVYQSTTSTDISENECKSDGNMVMSPLVGTFYDSSAPDAPSYVNVGDTVKKGQILGIIEAMKLMNEIESEYDGTIVSILVNNEQVVEYGQPLFVIRPNTPTA